jgi:serine/threonine protein kinase
MPSEAALRGMPQPGETVDGKYALVRVLGAGGMGVVFEAEHLRLKQRCAIKMLAPEMLREADILHRFEREARASALLKSPHVTRVTDVATTRDGIPYIVMELLTGHDLDGEIQRRGRVPYPDAVDYMLQACAAVGDAHAAGIIHRDLKPGNLFLAQEPDGAIVKVLDFGISKMVDEESKLTSAGMTMGTALYMSPEQLRSAAKVDARSDIWSLGVILYELLCGEPPFVGTATQVAAAIVSVDAPDLMQRCAVPHALAAVVHRALRRDPAQRFEGAAELAAALVPFATPGSLGAAVAEQISKRSSSRRLGAHASVDRVATEASAAVVHGMASGLSHEVRPSARHDSSSRKVLVGALAAIVLIALSATAAAVLAVRRSPAKHASSAVASATEAREPAPPPTGTPAAAEPETRGTATVTVTTTAPATAPTPAAASASAVPVVRPTRPVTPPKATSTKPDPPAPPQTPPAFL